MRSSHFADAHARHPYDILYHACSNDIYHVLVCMFIVSSFSVVRMSRASQPANCIDSMRMLLMWFCSSDITPLTYLGRIYFITDDVGSNALENITVLFPFLNQMMAASVTENLHKNAIRVSWLFFCGIPNNQKIDVLNSLACAFTPHSSANTTSFPA